MNTNRNSQKPGKRKSWLTIVIVVALIVIFRTFLSSMFENNREETRDVTPENTLDLNLDIDDQTFFNPNDVSGDALFEAPAE